MSTPPFLTLPDDKIIQICESLDDKRLAKLMQAHGRIYQLCSFILEERKSEYTEELIEEFARNLTGRWQSHFRLKYQEGPVLRFREIPSLLDINASDPDTIYIIQGISDPRIPKLIQGMSLDRDGNWRIALPKNFETLIQVNNSLADQGYINQSTLGYLKGSQVASHTRF